MALMTTEAAGEFLSVSVWTVRSLIKRGELRAVKIGSEFRIDEADISAFINKNKTEVKTC